MSDTERAIGVAAYTMVLLCCGERYLLLHRAANKRFAPNRWTGLGGRVEPDELDDPYGSALRELDEEIGLAPVDIARLRLRRALLQARPGEPLTLLLYFTGELAEPISPACPEGRLRWVSQAELAGLDVIENTARVLPLLIDDRRRDPDGREPLRAGAVHFGPDGALERLVWA